MFICPHCDAQIEELDYSQRCTEYGTATLELGADDEVSVDDWHHGDTDDYGSYEYSCRECGQELEPDDVIYREEEDDEDQSIGTPNISFNRPQRATSQGLREEVVPDVAASLINAETYHCEYCMAVSSKETGETEPECDECGEKTILTNFTNHG